MLRLLDNSLPWFGEMMDLGGDILLIIIMVAAFLWALILERIYYINRIFPDQALQAQQLWQQRFERRSWFAERLRAYLLYRAWRNLQRSFPLLKTLIKLCPLLGLLGTVLGMLEIFDAVAATGGTNPRATAAGVSKAIITTMAGMVVAISALPVVGYLSRRIAVKKQQLADALPIDG